MNEQDKILRKTRSVCPVCLEEVPADVVQRKDAVLLTKLCAKHGHFEITLSRRAEFYKQLDAMYFDIMDEDKAVSEYEIWVTLQCNIECAICHLGEAKSVGEEWNPSLDAVEMFIKKHHAPCYVLSGGEPTCRDDIFEIIKLFKKHRKTVTMHTNGLKLHDSEYAARLKQAGLDRVNLQCDGFGRDSYKMFRGADLLDSKLSQLDVLKSLDIPVDLNITVARGVNDLDLGDVINYAAANDFIKGVNFFTICLLGGVRGWGLDRYIMPDEVVDGLEAQSGAKITRRNVFLFQKLHLAMKSWQGQRFCLYSQIFLLVRRDGSYESVDRFLNLERAEKWLDLYRRLYGRHRWLAKSVFVLTVPFALLRWSSLRLAKDIVLTGLSYFLQTPHYFKSKKFLFVSFSTACDPHKIDYGLLKNCQDDIVHVDAVSGELAYQGCDGLHCIEMERRHRGKNDQLAGHCHR